MAMNRKQMRKLTKHDREGMRAGNLIVGAFLKKITDYLDTDDEDNLCEKVKEDVRDFNTKWVFAASIYPILKEDWFMQYFGVKKDMSKDKMKEAIFVLSHRHIKENEPKMPYRKEKKIIGV
jgi:hypothetical protein